jgi:HTH-type transcriptional regulator, glycine betaine synthesis regulator
MSIEESKVSLPPEWEELAEQVGHFIEYWGFRAVLGKIWCHLFLSKDPLDASELISRLQVSKALMSISLKELLDYKVIEVFGKSERGTTLYSPNPELTDVILNVLRRREKKMLSQIGAAQQVLRDLPDQEKQEANIDSARLEHLGEMIRSAQAILGALVNLGTYDFVGIADFKYRPFASKGPFRRK